MGKSLPEVVRNTKLLNFVPRCLASDEPCEEEIVVLGEEERYLQAHGAALIGRRPGSDADDIASLQ